MEPLRCILPPCLLLMHYVSSIAKSIKAGGKDHKLEVDEGDKEGLSELGDVDSEAELGLSMLSTPGKLMYDNIDENKGDTT